jgi:CheY-like chemotaxis protein
MITIAVVDSYILVMQAIRNQLTSLGYNVNVQAAGWTDFVQQLRKCDVVPQVCIVDIDTPTIEQYTTAKLIKDSYPEMKIIAYTLFEMNYKEVKSFGIDLFIDKGCSIPQIQKEILGLIGNEL